MIARLITTTYTPASLYSLAGVQNPYCEGIILKPNSGSITFGNHGAEIIPLDETMPIMLMDLRNLWLVGDSSDCYVLIIDK